MKIITIIGVVLLLTTSWQSEPSVDLFKVEKDGYVELHVRNNSLYPVTINVQITKKNLSSSQQLPYVDVIQGREEKKLLELKPLNVNRPWEFETNYSFHKGDVFAKHNDNYEYQLPYRLGDSHKVTQGYNGSFSHTGSLSNSLDFDMPEGTPVHAARDGKVIEIKEMFDFGGPEEEFRDKGNFITILHDDGTFADYYHLRRNGASVLTGQRVRRGQLIGFSGATGYVTGPHLHFNVKKVDKGGRFITIPVKFATRQGNQQLNEGESYTAL